MTESATGDEKDWLEHIKALLQRLATDLGLPRKATDSLSSMPPWKLATLIQTAIERFRVERHQAVSLAGRVDALMSDLTDVVRGLPLGAIPGNDEPGGQLIAIRKIYRGPDTKSADHRASNAFSRGRGCEPGSQRARGTGTDTRDDSHRRGKWRIASKPGRSTRTNLATC